MSGHIGKYCPQTLPFSVVQHPGKKKCGYCRKGGETFDGATVVPAGFCIDAFYAVYPFLLGRLYDASFDTGLYGQDLIVTCPRPETPARIRVRAVPKAIKPLLNLGEKLFRLLGMPKDAIDKRILLETVSVPEGCVLASGQKTAVRIPDISSLCPASFYSFYHVYSGCLGGPASAAVPARFVCPDPVTDLSYRVTPNGGEPEEKASPCCLTSLASYRLTPSKGKPCGVLPTGIQLKDMIPDGVCPTLFNIAIPYLLTFKGGGYFKWRRDKNSVLVQCPDAQGRVQFEVRRGKNRELSINVTEVGGVCPRDHSRGQSYPVDLSRLACLHVFSRALPFILRREADRSGTSGSNGTEIICPVNACGASFILTRE